MKICLIEYVKPYERFVFSSAKKAKEHLAQEIKNDKDFVELQPMITLVEQVVGQPWDEYIINLPIAEFNELFGEEVATIAEFEVIE